MSTRRVASQFQTLFDSGVLSALPDPQLLDRFTRLGDREAFEALVGRHGPMVMGICRRVLGDASDADDAFQATFLVLIRRAPALRSDVVLAAWLHGVASKVARRARSDRARRSARERTAMDVEPAVEQTTADFALKAVVDEEVERLPWKYRVPVALCYLEGLTHEEAARRLEWPIGSVKGRLARAKTLLGSRLARRGVTAGVAAAAVDGLTEAAVSEASRRALVRAAERIAWGGSWKSVVSDRVVHLTGEVLTSMLLTKLKAAALLVAAIGLTATGVGFAAREGDAGPSEIPPASLLPPGAQARNESEQNVDARQPNKQKRINAPASPEDRYVDAARRAYLTVSEWHPQTLDLIDIVYRASRRLLDAQTTAARTPEARRTALTAHLDRMRTLSHKANEKGGVEAMPIAAEAHAMVAEAELWLARGGEAPREVDPPMPGSGDTGANEGDRNPRSKMMLKKLEEPIAMIFPNETPLEDILKYVKQATDAPNDDGLELYVDPQGLQEADKTLTSPVALEVEGVPLRRTLQLLLDQLGLVYFVEDGMVVITAAGRNSYGLKPTMAKSTPLDEEVGRAKRGELSTEELNALIEKMKLIQQVAELHHPTASRPTETPKSP
ncbi:RNA polymerase sigma factor [Paludisphaera rhizosphaerae]|uniref:RNA polymerase sigma factor n=1 Tax=Paludisphaera rhizosphaerae TaxID=2711216 RepID=UPI0013EDC6FF|nr:RNA polymerase sigma factor [Paludisphaera rhizosphaerae]